MYDNSTSYNIEKFIHTLKREQKKERNAVTAVLAPQDLKPRPYRSRDGSGWDSSRQLAGVSPDAWGSWICKEDIPPPLSPPSPQQGTSAMQPEEEPSPPRKQRRDHVVEAILKEGERDEARFRHLEAHTDRLLKVFRSWSAPGPDPAGQDPPRHQGTSSVVALNC